MRPRRPQDRLWGRVFEAGPESQGRRFGSPPRDRRSSRSSLELRSPQPEVLFPAPSPPQLPSPSGSLEPAPSASTAGLPPSGPGPQLSIAHGEPVSVHRWCGPWSSPRHRELRRRSLRRWTLSHGEHGSMKPTQSSLPFRQNSPKRSKAQSHRAAPRGPRGHSLGPLVRRNAAPSKHSERRSERQSPPRRQGAPGRPSAPESAPPADPARPR